jgi:hypothetical protein
MINLEAEFDRCLDSLDEQHFARFAELGIPTAVTFGLRSLYGVGRIIQHTCGLFDFHEDGAEAIVIAEGTPDLPGWHWLDDLVALIPDQPERWWLRRGQVDLLGSYNLSSHKLDDTRLYANPLDWMRNGATGICIVDWRLDPDRLLYGAGKIVTDSHELRRRLHKRIMENALARYDLEVANAA